MASIEFNCPNCGETLEASPDMGGDLIDCPNCSETLEVPYKTRTEEPFQISSESLVQTESPPSQPATQPIAYKKKKSEIIGVGSLVQGVGLILCFIWFPFGLLFGMVFIVVGGRMSRKLTCSVCGNRIESKDVRICPVCKSVFSN